MDWLLAFWLGQLIGWVFSSLLWWFIFRTYRETMKREIFCALDNLETVAKAAIQRNSHVSR